MEEKFNEATIHRPKGDRLLDAQLVTIDLNLFIQQIKEEKKWIETDRNAITVFKSGGCCIVLIALHKGAEMPKHNANGIINLQVLEGLIKFSSETESLKLSKGQMMVLHESVPHSLLAIEETVLLLTISTTLK